MIGLLDIKILNVSMKKAWQECETPRDWSKIALQHQSGLQASVSIISYIFLQLLIVNCSCLPYQTCVGTVIHCNLQAYSNTQTHGLVGQMYFIASRE